MPSFFTWYVTWSRNQNSAEVPKAVPMRYAISGVIARLSWMMSDTADCGFPIAFANLYCEMPKGSRNSSFRISPGEEMISLAMVVIKLNPFYSERRPSETNTPLAINPNAVLTRPVSRKQL